MLSQSAPPVQHVCAPPLLAPALLRAADTPEDTKIVKIVRKKLKDTKVSVDFQETPLKDALEDLKGKAEGEGTTISFTVDAKAGVSGQSSVASTRTRASTPVNSIRSSAGSTATPAAASRRSTAVGSNSSGTSGATAASAATARSRE